MPQELDNLRIYKAAMDIGEDVWNIVLPWPYIAKDTIGKQFVRSADSIAANIAEGFGRFHHQENKRFCYYARGSLVETQTWLTKAGSRQIIDCPTRERLIQELQSLHRSLNAYINAIGASQ